MDQEGSKEKTKKRFRPLVPAVIIAAIAAVLVFVLVAVYREGASFYEEHFFPNTTISGVDVGNMTPDEAEQAITDLISDHTLTITDGSGSYSTTLADAGVSFSYGDSIYSLLGLQDPQHWMRHETLDGSADVSAEISDDSVNALLHALPCYAGEITEPEDAYIYYDAENTSYSLINEVEGNAPNDNSMASALRTALTEAYDTLDISGPEYYRHPSVTADDPDLNSLYQVLATYMSASVTYADGSIVYEVPKSKIHEWIIIDGNSASLDWDAMYAFVTDYVCPKFNTLGTTRTLTTPLSGTFTVSGGTYGYDVWRTPETEQLTEDISSGSTVSRAPVYYASGYGRGVNDDIGSTYIDVNLSMQKVALVQNGVMTVETDCVTGNTGAGYVTPDGVYQIEVKMTNYTMVKYDAFVYYWMPIDLDTEVGLHDATWRSEFGGDIYKTNGSHGCINLPYSAAEEIYERAEVGTPVIVHW